MCEVTFEDMPKLVQSLTHQVESLTEIVLSLNEQMHKQRAVLVDKNKKIFGIFDQDELISSTDDRLWKLPQSPFKSKYSVYTAKVKGCPFKKPLNGGGTLKIKATDLEKWLIPQAKLN